jgi:hypothetical protein
MADDYTEFEEEHQFNEWLYNKFGSLRIVPESERNAICLLPMRDLDAKVYGPFKDITATKPHDEVNIMFISWKNSSEESEIKETLFSYKRKCLGMCSHFFEWPEARGNVEFGDLTLKQSHHRVLLIYY